MLPHRYAIRTAVAKGEKHLESQTNPTKRKTRLSELGSIGKTVKDLAN